MLIELTLKSGEYCLINPQYIIAVRVIDGITNILVTDGKSTTKWEVQESIKEIKEMSMVSQW